MPLSLIGLVIIATLIGVEQAKALEKADIKVIANNGSVTGGINSLGELFTSQGGTNIGALLEGMSQTPAGKALMDKIVGGGK